MRYVIENIYNKKYVRQVIEEIRLLVFLFISNRTQIISDII